MKGLVGSYTKNSKTGIYGFTIDTNKDELEAVYELADTPGPSYLEVNNDRVYAIYKGEEKAGVVTFDFDETELRLKEIEKLTYQDAGACYIAMTSDHNYLVDAVYLSGEVRLYKIDERGVVIDRLDVFQVEGDGPHERQDNPHSHYIDETPDKLYLVAVDLGADKVITLKIQDDQFEVVNELRVAPGSGPRHIEFSNSGKYAYIFTELSNEIIITHYNDGQFEVIDTVSTLPKDFDGHSQGAAIRKSPDGKHIYVSNRGHDSIAVFKVKDDGMLECIQIESTHGEWPRDFNISHDGKYLVVAHEETNNLVLFIIGEDGKITRTEKELEAPEGLFVTFV